MSIDRFVYFKKEIPSQDQLKMILEDYLGGLGSIEYGESWTVSLPGKPTFPFNRLCNKNPMVHDERWFEIYFDLDDNREGGFQPTLWLDPLTPHIDVVTRMADELTNNIARGYADLLVRYYRAEVRDYRASSIA